ncbi:retropepsin-like aspartic protease [Brevundimonas sp. UBA7664]|uniref:retropepsin-like aspartic protease n=1 Tax=Brevundimonas sp. UBA7664 TaxID=1946141 RepID=UPI0025BB0708|nr:retropepsin-like aspartic protease [Brevundimonas sp. UBA7664]
MKVTRRSAALGLAMLGAGAGSASSQQAEPGLANVRSDSGGRLTIPVFINGQRPLRFAVDSAANASVIASDLVESLGLTALPDADINTLIALERVPMAGAASLRAGAIERSDVRLAVADRGGLGGVDGLLGTDILAGHRLVMEFARRRMRIVESRSSGTYLFKEGRSSVRYRAPAEQRFNNLMMVDAVVGGVSCKVIIDTGARITIVNRALATASGARPIVLDDGSRIQAVESPTGRSQEAEAMLLPTLGFGGITLRRVPVLVGDFHTFRIWGLQDRPVVLLGSDLLGLFKRVSIDLGHSELLLEV